MTFEDGLAEDRFAGHRLIVAHDPMRAAEQGDRHRARTALDLLERIKRHTSKIGERTLNGLSTITPEQLELFDTLDIPNPA